MFKADSMHANIVGPPSIKSIAGVTDGAPAQFKQEIEKSDMPEIKRDLTRNRNVSRLARSCQGNDHIS